MAFSDYLGRCSVGLVPYVRISGIPYVFSTIDLPDAWDNGSGKVQLGAEIHDWSKTLLWDREHSTAGDELQPKRGDWTPGQSSLRFDLGMSDDALWLSLTNDNPARSDIVATTLLESITVAQTTDIIVRDESVWSADDLIHLGTECMRVTTIGGTSTLSTVQRGRYGSWARYHPAGDESAGIDVSGAGGVLSSVPLQWRGRVVELYLAAGVWLQDGTFLPYSIAANGTADTMIDRCVIVDREYSADISQVELSLASLSLMTQRTIAVRNPRGRAVQYSLDGEPIIQFAGDCNQIRYAFTKTDENAGNAYILNERTLRNSTDTADISTGTFYRLRDVETALEATIADGALPTNSSTPDVSVALSLDEDGKVTVGIGLVGAAQPAEYTLTIDALAANSAWRALGFEHAAVVAPANQTATFIQWSVTADRALPALYLPAISKQQTGIDRYVPVVPEAGADFDADFSPAKKDGSGNVAPAYRLGDQTIFETDAFGTTFSLSRLEVFDRLVYGERQAPEIYEEIDPEDPFSLPIVRGVGFAGVGEFSMLLHLMLGFTGVPGTNSTYDEGWAERDHIPASFVDIESFEALERDTQPPSGADNWIFFEPTSVQDVIRQVCAANNAFVCAAYNPDDEQVKIRAFKAELPTQSDASSPALALDNSNTLTGVGFGLEHRVETTALINTVRGSAGYDNVRGQFLAELVSRDLTSINTFGAAAPWDLEIRGFSNPLDAFGRMVDVAQELFATYGFPYQVLTIAYTTSLGWDIQIGDTVTVSNDLIPTRQSAGRGQTAQPFRVMGHTRIPRGSRMLAARGVLTLFGANEGAPSFVEWAPCARVTAVTSGTDLTIDVDQYSPSGADTTDEEWWTSGATVEIWERGDFSTVVERVVASVSAGTIVLTASISLTPPLILRSAPYDTVSVYDYQREVAYLSDGVSLTSGTGAEDEQKQWA